MSRRANSGLKHSSRVTTLAKLSIFGVADVSAMPAMANLVGDARMTNDILDQSATYGHFIEVVRRRRSVRRFAKGREVSRDTLLKIAEAARWAPTGANAQCWDLIVIDDKKARQNVLDVFLRQSQRLVDHAKGFQLQLATWLLQNWTH